MPSLTPLHEPFCTLHREPPTQGDLLEGMAQLATTSIAGVTDLVQAIHREIVLRPLGLHSPKNQARWNKGITGRIYNLIKDMTHQSGAGLAVTLRTVNKLSPSQKRRQLTPLMHFLVGVLNGVAGDHLIRMRNPLALPMMFYDRYGQPQRGELRGRVVILAHGLCMNHLSWDPGESVGLGEQVLYRQPSSTVLYLSYNTGRRISQNGRSYARLLNELLEKNPLITEIDLIGHSMGGLISRSALFYGKQMGHNWLNIVDHLVCIGSPHHGAVLERLGFMLQDRVGRLPFAGALARLGDIRSAGVIDLRHGSVRDDDWEHLEERRGQFDDTRKPAPLPSSVKAYFIAGTLESGPSTSRTREAIGDYLVSVKSALGEHDNPVYQLRVPEERKAVFYGINHFELQYHPAVRDQVIAWLVPGAYLPHTVDHRIEYIEQ
jgi:pimeloyl-ACP methyl ester carboxylesterase